MDTIESVERLIYTEESNNKLDNNNTWVTPITDVDGNQTGEVYSGCIMIKGESFNGDNGFVSERKFAYWLKAPSQESLDKNIERRMNDIKNGTRVPLVRYCTEPYYDGQEPDLNLKTKEPMTAPADLNAELGKPNSLRYSRVALLPSAKAIELDRTFEAPKDVVPDTVGTPDVETNKEVTNEA